MILISGLDLGQTTDFTAFATLEKAGDIYHCRKIERFQIGTSYTSIVQHMEGLYRKQPFLGSSLAVDQTGVGRPVVDMMRVSEVGQWDLHPITITAGHTVTKTEDGDWHVPKKDVITALMIAFQARRLQVIPHLKLAALLTKELTNFRTKVTKSANEVFEAREGEHDDLVLAVAMAVWIGENTFTGTWDATPAPGQLADWTKAPPGVWNDQGDRRSIYDMPE